MKLALLGVLLLDAAAPRVVSRVAPGVSRPGVAPTAAPSLPALTPSLPALPALTPAPGIAPLPAAAAVELASPDAPSETSVRAAAAPFDGSAAEAEPLWSEPVPASQARKLLRRAHWQTFKFFMGSRSALLRDMVKKQEAETAGKPRAVENLEGMWLDWRTKAYGGGIKTAGFTVADRGTIKKEALRLWAKHFPKDKAASDAFRRYLDRVDAAVPEERPSYYRKKAFGVFYETPTLRPEELPARIDGMLSADQLAAIAAHRAGRQQEVLASFKAAVLSSIAGVNKTLPKGRRVIALVLLGSYSIGQSGPSSDIDYQLVTEDGGLEAIKPFAAALDANWKENRLELVEGFASTLPPSPEVVKESFPEGYLVISPDPAAVAALSKDSFKPEPPTRWSRLKGKAFGAAWKAWVWTYFRAADLRDALSRL